jgi:gluconokinase
MKKMAVIMGVAGCGKTTVGERLADATGFRFLDGDRLHPPSNIEKMSEGIPLADDDRWPWLEAVGDALAQSAGSIVVGCSALKRTYRDRIRRHAGGPVTFVHLSGSRELIGERMRARQGHFMPPSLLDSQFATLEPPLADEDAIVVDIAKPLDETVEMLARSLGKG